MGYLRTLGNFVLIMVFVAVIGGYFVSLLTILTAVPIYGYGLLLLIVPMILTVPLTSKLFEWIFEVIIE